MVDERDERRRGRREEPYSGPETTASFGYEFGSQLAQMAGRSTEEQAAVGALPSGSALLVVRRGPNVGARFLLDSDVTVAGRHPSADIFLDDVTVSRRHAEFRRDGAEFVVVDVGSLNGTYVNREPVDTAVLANGDEVQIGKFRLVFLTGPRDGGSTGAGAGLE